MIEFATYPECRRCGLHETATHRGLPARPSDHDQPGIAPTGPGNGQALFVVGEAPGINEDRAGKIWIGRSGGTLHLWLEMAGIAGGLDTYLSNACRCLPAQGRNAISGQIKSCRPHLLRDIHALHEKYPGKLTILCMGAAATRSLLNMNLKAAFDMAQGRTVLIPPPSAFCPECKYHIFPGFPKSKGTAIINSTRSPAT